MEPPQLSVSEERHLAILTELPFVVQFEERVKVRVILQTFSKMLQGRKEFTFKINTNACCHCFDRVREIYATCLYDEEQKLYLINRYAARLRKG